MTGSGAEHSGVPRAAVFLDRDGTVIADRHYLGSPDGVELLPGAAEAVARLNQADIPVVLVTNQSGIGRGYFSAADFHDVQKRLATLLAEADAYLDGVYFCPHSPDEPRCDCRKPGIGLFMRASADLGLDLTSSFFVGDRLRDVQPAFEFGATGFLLEAPVGSVEPLPEPWVSSGQITVVESLAEAVAIILKGRPAD